MHLRGRWLDGSKPGHRRGFRGPGCALEQASGGYFTFVDADDLLHPQTLSILLNLAQCHGADLVVCEYFRFRLDSEFDRQCNTLALLPGDCVAHQAPLLPLMVDWKKFRAHPVGKLYERSIHKDLRFPRLFGAEDAYASFDVYARSRRAVFCADRLYGYRVVEDGLTRSSAKYRNYIQGDAETAIHGEQVLARHGVDAATRSRIVMPYIMRMFAHLNEMCSDGRLAPEQKRELLALARDGLRRARRSVGGSYRTVSPVHYVPYCAVCLGSLRLLAAWQRLRKLAAPRLKGNVPGAPRSANRLMRARHHG